MSIFLDRTADTPTFRILDYFIEARETDHAIADVIAATDMARSTFYNAWPSLLSNKYVVLKRTVGKTRLYQLNTTNRYVLAFILIFDRALRERPHKKRERIVA